MIQEKPVKIQPFPGILLPRQNRSVIKRLHRQPCGKQHIHGVGRVEADGNPGDFEVQARNPAVLNQTLKKEVPI
jgi:hypothetical protein